MKEATTNDEKKALKDSIPRGPKALPLEEWADEELCVEIERLQGSEVGTVVMWRETLRHELELRELRAQIAQPPHAKPAGKKRSAKRG